MSTSTLAHLVEPVATVVGGREAVDEGGGDGPSDRIRSTSRHTRGVGVLIRDGLEVLIVIAVGGMLAAAVGRLRRGEVRVYRCFFCDRPTSRAYPRCKHCDAEQPDAI